MIKLIVLILTLLIQNIALSQTEKNRYPFKVDLISKGKPISLIPGLDFTGKVNSFILGNV